MYQRGNRELQAHFGSTALADRLVERLHRTQLNDADKLFIEGLPYFLLATADAQGRPDCSFKGGAPGFVRVVSPALLVFPDYDGNGMFKSLGNIRSNPHVGLLFIAMSETPRRLRVNGTAEVVLDDPLMNQFEGAQALVRVTPQHIFPNCPRYIPDAKSGTASPYIPCSGVERQEPAWKTREDFRDVVPARRDTKERA
jgi:uncharacterized protein